MKKAHVKKVSAVILSLAMVLSSFFAVSAAGDTEAGTNGESVSYGTATDGIILDSSNKSVSNLPAIDGFNNFDFSNGLVNFGPRDTWTGFWEKLSVIGITAENGMLKMSHTTDKNADNDYPGFRSVNVKIPDSAKGKKVFVNLDAASNQDFAVRIVVDGITSSWVWIRNYNYGTDTTTPTLKNVIAKESFTGTFIEESASEIAVEVQAQNIENRCTYIDNIKFIYYDDQNSTTGNYTDFDGNRYNSKGEPLYGTEDKGIPYGETELLKMDAVDGLQNGDFEQGLKYWGGVDGCTNPSTIATVKSEGNNKYLHIDTTSASTKYQGVITVPFKVSGVNAGDYVGVRLKYRSSDTDTKSIRIGLSQNHYYRSAYKACNAWYTAPTADGEWKTLVTTETENGAKLKAVTAPESGDIFFMLRITGNGSNIVCDIDDIEIIKFADENGKMYSTLDGEWFNSNGLPLYGTAEDGITLSNSIKKIADIPAIDAFDNFDFSNGLVNFGPRDPGSNNFWTKLSDIGITAEDGMLKIDYKENSSTYDSYIGFQSVAVKIPENIDLTGKKLYVNLDVATLQGFNIRVLVDGKGGTWANINAGTGDVNTKTLVNLTASDNGTEVTEGAKTIAIELQTPHTADAYTFIDNIKIVYDDIGGMNNMFAGIDGSIVGDWEEGDANADKTVDIRDLVRVKKYTADKTEPIYYAAAKMDKNTDELGASDIAALRKKLLEAPAGNSVDTTRYYNYSNYAVGGLYGLVKNGESEVTPAGVTWTTGLKAPGEGSFFEIAVGGENHPLIAEATSQAAANESVTIMGEGFNAETKAYYIKNNSAVEAEYTLVNDTQMEITIDKNETFGVYGVYVTNKNGNSNIALVNAPKIWWIGFTETNAGKKLEIYGENLTVDKGNNTNVYLIDGKKYCSLKVVSANPYKVIVEIPAGLEENKDYTLKLHNGYGGKYAWAEAAEKVTFKNVSTAGAAKTVTVNGNDNAAIETAIASAADGDTIYFPSGTYTLKTGITVNKQLSFKGENPNTSKIVIDNEATGVNGAAFYVTKKCEFTGLAFEDVRKNAFTLNFIRYQQDGNANYNYEVTSTGNLYVHGCKFLQSTTPDAKSDKSAILVSESSGIVIENNYFETTQVLTVRNVSKLFVRNNEVCGVSYCNDDDNHNSFLIWDTDMMDISSNQLYGKDYLTDKSGEIVKGDQTIGRSFALQQWNRNGYISDNEIKHVGLYGNNSGEQIMLENISNVYQGSVVSAADTTVTVASDIKTDVHNSYDCISKKSIAVIVSGKGVGQYRTVAAYADKVVTLDTAWEIVPDTTSKIMIFNGFSDFAIYNNNIDGFSNHNASYNASCGIQVYGNAVNNFITENDISNTAYGVCIISHYRCNDNENITNGIYWLQCDDNKISNTSIGIRYSTGYMPQSNSNEIPMYLTFGNTVRGNSINKTLNFLYGTKKNLGGVAIEIGTRDHSFITQPATNTWNGNWQNGTLIENNIIIASEIFNILLCKHQGNTILRGNSVSSGELYYKEIGNGITVSDPIIKN